MKIIESWEDTNDNKYAIGLYSLYEQKDFNVKRFEVLWLDEENDNQLCSFAGCVGWTVAHFGGLKQAHDYLINCLVGQAYNPDIWFDELKVV